MKHADSAVWVADLCACDKFGALDDIEVAHCIPVIVLKQDSKPH